MDLLSDLTGYLPMLAKVVEISLENNTPTVRMCGTLLSYGFIQK